MPPAQPEPPMVNQDETGEKGKMIKSARRFSRSQLVVFALAFALIGTYAIYRTFANQPVEGLLHTNGTLVQFNDRKVYLVEDGKLRPVPHEVYQSHNFDVSEIRNGTEVDAKLPIGEPLELAEGTIVEEGDKTYQIDSSNGRLLKRLIEDSQRLGQLNTSSVDITRLSNSALPRVSDEPIKEFTGKESHPNGTVILSADGKSYVIENDRRRLVPNAAIGLTHRLDHKTITAESEGDKSLPLGAPLSPKEGSVVKGSDDTIYVIEKVKTSRFFGIRGSETLVKRPLRSQVAFIAYGYKDSDVVELSSSELSRLPTGSPLPQSESAPVQIVIWLKRGENSKTVSDEYIKQGAKLRHIYPEWFSVELPHDQYERIKSDARIQKLEGNAQKSAYCMDSATVVCGGPSICNDGSDNDGDGKIDYPADPGCTDASDGDESDATSPTPPPSQPPPPPPPPAGQPPSLQTEPTIDGTAKVGQVLVGGSGTWANGVKYFTYQWQRCTSNQPEGYGSNCSNISGATNQNYQIVEADKGRYLRIYVTASNDYGASSASSKVTSIVGQEQTPGPTPTPPPPSPGQPAPVINRWDFASGNTWLYSVNTANHCEVHLQTGGVQPFTPSLGGTYTVTAGSGNTSGQLRCWNGTIGPVSSGWAGPSTPTPPPPPPPGMPAPTINLWKFNSGNSWSYNTSNATYCEVHLASGGIQPFTPTNGGQYSVTAGSGNTSGQLKCWNNGIGPTVSAWEGPAPQAPPSPPPSGPVPIPDQNPTITGIAQVGQTLRADPGYWKNGVSSFSYQWYRCSDVDSLGYGVNCGAISGATVTTYSLTATDAGYRIVVKVTAKNTYGSTSAASLATVIVTSPTGTAEITSEPASPVAKGTPVKLKWYMQYGQLCTASATPNNLNWFGPKPPTGSQSVGSVSVTTDFKMTCTYGGASGSQKATTTLKVVVIDGTNPPPTNPPPGPSPKPSVNISATPATSVPAGTNVNIVWNGTNITSCTASSSPSNSAWNGGKPVSGNQSVGALNATTTFNINCSGSGGSVSNSVTVTVTTAALTAFERNSPHLARVGGGGGGGSVAVVDSGIAPHPLLTISGGHNCIAGDTTGTNDVHGHGTAVAGVIGARGDGISTPRGIAPGAAVIPVKVIAPNGSGAGDDIACGIRWAADNAGTMNLSFSGPIEANSGSCDSTVMHQAICYARSKGARIVVGAGYGTKHVSQTYPAGYAEISASVSMMTDNDGRPGGQNLGAGGPSNCNGDDQVLANSDYGTTITAPGCVFTTGLNSTVQRGAGGNSFAAPMVAGSSCGSSSDPAYTYLPPSNGHSYGPLLRC